jgi:hypothetical protein
MGVPATHTSSAVCSSQSGVAQEQRRLLASHWWVSHACPKIANLTPIITLHHFTFHFSPTVIFAAYLYRVVSVSGGCSVAIHVGSWSVLYNPSHLLISSSSSFSDVCEIITNYCSTAAEAAHGSNCSHPRDRLGSGSQGWFLAQQANTAQKDLYLPAPAYQCSASRSLVSDPR